MKRWNLKWKKTPCFTQFLIHKKEYRKKFKLHGQQRNLVSTIISATFAVILLNVQVLASNQYYKIALFFKNEPLGGSSYFPLPEKLNNSVKELINIENQDNRSFNCCLVRYLHLVEKNPAKIEIIDKTT